MGIPSQLNLESRLQARTNEELQELIQHQVAKQAKYPSLDAAIAWVREQEETAPSKEYGQWMARLDGWLEELKGFRSRAPQPYIRSDVRTEVKQEDGTWKETPIPLLQPGSTVKMVYTAGRSLPDEIFILRSYPAIVPTSEAGVYMISLPSVEDPT